MKAAHYNRAPRAVKRAIQRPRVTGSRSKTAAIKSGRFQKRAGGPVLKNLFVGLVPLRYRRRPVNSSLLKTLVVYAIILPLAVVLGWMAVDLADWDRTSFTVFAFVGFVLLLPLLLKWHYPVLVMGWNTAITLFFLPGRPGLWMAMSVLTFGMAVLNRIVQKRPLFISVPSITLPLLAIAAITLLTAKFRGGLGLSAFGSSSVGGKGYFYILAAVIGYFAFASQTIPREHAKIYAGLFFLAGAITAAGSTLIYMAGPAFYFLFLIFPSGYAAVQAMTETAGSIGRVAGLGVAANAAGCFIFMMYGCRGVLQKWWRLLAVLVLLAAGTMSGYRSHLVALGAIVGILFIVEGLLRSPIFPALLLAGVLGLFLLMPFTTRLPFSVQRALSFLPVEVDAQVKMDARSSLEWRWEMWRALLPELPKYIWFGKGFSQSPTDIYLTQQAVLRGRVPGYQGAILSGDYHSGPLSLYIPFGSFGVLAFLVFVGASLRVLYFNCRHGPAELRVINRFLFAYFAGRILFFIFAFGGYSYELCVFTGTIGLSVALNGGVCRAPATAPRPVRFRGDLALRPAQPGAA